MTTKKADRQPDYGQVRLLVYGTLKQGHYNNTLLKNAGAKFMGYDYLNIPNATFIDFGGFPALVHPLVGASKDKQIICGELWYGYSDILKSCDILEGHPDFFHRTKQRSEIFDRKCWVYTLKEEWIGEAVEFVDGEVWKPEKAEKLFWTKFKSHNTLGALRV